MRKIKSVIIVILIVLSIFGFTPRQVVFAEDVAPSPSPSAQPDASLSPDPSPSPSPDPSPSPSPSVASSPDPSPTPIPSPTPCPTGCDTTPVGTVDQSNGTAIDNTVQSGSNTGNNTIDNIGIKRLEATGSAQPESTPSAQSENNSQAKGQSSPANTISTGEANTQADVVNLANTNKTNSDTNFQIQNVFGNQTGNITLLDAGANAPEPSLLLVNQQNTGTITNYILVYANSGWNLIKGGIGDIQTGAAYATVNVINFVNANLANSQLSFAIINVFGNLTGNIVLPEPSQLATLLGGNANINQSNSGSVQNNVAASSDTGNNNLNGSGSVETGNATTLANVINNVNSNMLGGSFYHLLINNYGTWNGQFVGWGNLAPEDPHYGHMFFDVNNMPPLDTLVLNGEINQKNDATVNNIIVTTATTGNNQIDGSGNIKTGNAFSTVNLLNFVNTNWAGVRGFFGLINILGTLNGNVGGKDHFVTLIVPPSPPPTSPANTASAQEVRQPGGQLASSISTNVGTHVNPGDTVMFFITVQNTGNGPVYDGKLVFNLNDPNGNLGALQNFNLGKLNPGQKVKISFGAVLSHTAPSGVYEALIQASGKTGPNDDQVTSEGSTHFLVGQPGIVNLNNLIPEVQAAGDAQNTPVITGHQSGIFYSETWGNIFLVLLFLTYARMLQLLYKKDKEVIIEKTSKAS